ncbi:MAG: beta-glucosidase [Bacteroidales bacterium]|nr:beta-glucosidase [Bacteroidales bacterium]
MKNKRLSTFSILLFFIPIFSSISAQESLSRRIEDLLSNMSIEEKVGQMAQITLDAIGNGATVFESKIPFAIDTARLRKAIVDYHVGSVINTTNNYALSPAQWNSVVAKIQEAAMTKTTYGIPVIYGIDAIHGVNYTSGATLFPQQIAIAATFEPQNAYNMAKVTAYETRASGIPWNFSPVLDLGADPRFSRQYEGFGEDPYLASIMGRQTIKGYEGITDSIWHREKIAACAKHFLGYSVPFSGKDRTPAYIPDHILREYHLPSFKAAIDEGVESVMINSGIINGVSVHANYNIITKLLKEELGFQGVVVSDWMDIINLEKRDKIAKNNKEAIALAVNAGIDMSMIPYDYENFCKDLIALVKEGKVKESRIDDAVRRILRLKFKLGLFENPITKWSDYPDFGSNKHAELAYKAAADAITLLKNTNNVLPLNKNAKILVTGPNANSMRSLNGGWSYSWQGEKTEKFANRYNTILEAIQNKIGDKNVVYVPGVSYVETGQYFEEKENDLQKAVAAARKVDAIVLCLGENSYAEKPGDLNDLNLSQLQIKLAKSLAEVNKPIILVLNEGRPRCFSAIESKMHGIIQTYLPGNYGGDALADILFGEVNPSGKLPYTYPAYPNSIVNYYHKFSEEQKPSEGAYKYESDYNPQYEFGYGLSYTTFVYSNLKISSSVLRPNEVLEVSVDVTNTGTREGKETVLMFTSDVIACITPDMKRLRRFEKINLKPNETKTVKFTLSSDDLAFVNTDNQWTIEPGEFEIKIGNLKKSINYQSTN